MSLKGSPSRYKAPERLIGLIFVERGETRENIRSEHRRDPKINSTAHDTELSGARIPGRLSLPGLRALTAIP